MEKKGWLSNLNKRIKITHKINALIVSFVISIFVFFTLMFNGQNNLKNVAVNKTTQIIDSTERVKIKIATHLVATTLSEGITKNKITNTDSLYSYFTTHLKNLNYEDDKSGYFFIYKGTTCFYITVNKSFEGQDLANLKDANGEVFVTKLANGAKNGGDFVYYHFEKPGKGIAEKISYAEMINGTDYWIGTGAYLDNLKAVTDDINNTIISNSSSIIESIIIFLLVLLIIVIAISLNTKKSIIKPINKIIEDTDNIALGKLNEVYHDKEDEIKLITDSLNNMMNNLKKTVEFAKNIGDNNFDVDFEKVSDHDVLGESLINMRNSLKEAKMAELERANEERKRNWAINGISNIAEILRNNQHNIDALTDSVLSEIISYTNMNQGGIFLMSDKSSDLLELSSSYAFDRKKFIHKTIELGEGLVGTCAIEKQTIYMTSIPNDYINITSGLGGANPRSLIIIPMLADDKLLGVIELASFNELEKYQIDFLEKVAQDIAATISSAQITIRTAHLLKQSKTQAEELASQEEEMRQNMEELQATNEEWQRKEKELYNKIEQLEQQLEKQLQ
ncbi:MAG: cache domain-containing protein [Bacteroidales bacterium]|nr:cache domain-containing protein [Bacteroidales bacterium]